MLEEVLSCVVGCDATGHDAADASAKLNECVIQLAEDRVGIDVPTGTQRISV